MASLKSQSEPHNWYSNLGWILLGIRSTIRENNDFSTAEMIYGTPLRLPGEYFADKATEPSASEYVKQLQNFVHSLQPTPTRHAGSRTTYINKALASCSHVFVRHNGVRSPLQQPYKGPFAVLQRSEKFFKPDMNGTIDNVSIDRLKPTYLLNAYDLSKSEMNEFSTSANFAHRRKRAKFIVQKLNSLALVYTLKLNVPSPYLHAFLKMRCVTPLKLYSFLITVLSCISCR